MVAPDAGEDRIACLNWQTHAMSRSGMGRTRLCVLCNLRLMLAMPGRGTATMTAIACFSAGHSARV